jgi:ribonuclease VapC
VSEPRASVLDASALLAMLHGESGAELVQAAVDRGVISTVNWAEVFRLLLDGDVDVVGLRADIEALGLEIVPFTVDDAEQAAGLGPPTRHVGLLLGDRACLALAHRLGLPVLTADRSWLDLDLEIKVEAIR